MTANDLVEGDPRVGFLFDGHEDTPHIAACLERTERSIVATVPAFDEVNHELVRWFVDTDHWGDEPDQTRFRYDLPTELDYLDARGPVALIGCRSAGVTLSLGSGANEGRIAVDYAVIGGQNAPDYRLLNGLRSEVEGLGTWMGLRSLTTDFQFAAGNGLASAQLTLRSPSPRRVVRNLNTTIRPTFQVGPGPFLDQTTITERMYVQTQVRTAHEWTTHLDVHFAVRDLLRVAAWRDLNFLSHAALGYHDPDRSLDGEARGHQWRPVVTVRTGVSKPSGLKRNSLDFLFTFNDVHAAGVARWVELRKRHDRGIAPALALLDMRGITTQAAVAQIGIAIEALGYGVLRESGLSRRKASDAPFADRIASVVDEVGAALPLNLDSLKDQIRVAYRGAKHGDKTLPEPIAAEIAFLKGVLLFRAWVALRLGSARSTIAEKLETDQLLRRVRSLESLR